MKSALIGNKPKSLHALFREYGVVATQWPETHCPECKKHLYFYGKKGLFYYISGIKMPSGTAKPSLRHYPKEANGCLLAKQEYEHAGKVKEDDILYGPVVREACLSDINYERTKAVCWKVLGPYNFSREKISKLISNADKNNLWGECGFPSWATAYMLFLNSTINFKFYTQNTQPVRFIIERKKGRPYLTMTYANTGRRVNNFYSYSLSEQAADEYLTKYRRDCEFDRHLPYGVPQQADMFSALRNVNTTRPSPRLTGKKAPEPAPHP